MRFFSVVAMPDQMQPIAGQLALASDARVGQPDRRHQVPPRQLGQHPRVDLVGLAGQRREALDLLRVGDQHVPAPLLERVVDESRTGHRLDHRSDPLTAEPLREIAQPVGVRRRRELRHRRAGRVDDTNIEPTSTQVQPNVQLRTGLLVLAPR